MIRISQIKLRINHTEEELLEAIRKKAHGNTPLTWRIVKRSIDARKKPELYYIYTIEASFPNEKKVLHFKNSSWNVAKTEKYHFPHKNTKKLKLHERPVIIGLGPAGLFAGVILARNGFSPVIFERGDSIEERTKKVEAFFEKNILDEESNVQFGEGGAGTFSDGKLNTLVKDKYGRNRFVLEEFVRHGAPEEILYDAKPHIGTDILKSVVASIREEILSLGGEIYFGAKVTELITKEETASFEKPCMKRMIGLRVQIRKEEQIECLEWPCEQAILAIGHSSRDTFSMLYDQQAVMTPKAFAVGLRVEHPAEMINESQYGKNYPSSLSAASYKLAHACDNGRNVYSFCMCPGGYVVNSSSETGRLCVNGMSFYGRDAHNSNSAIITTVTPEDFGSLHPLAGVEFQRKYETLAYQAGKGRIPVQLYGDLKAGKISTGFGNFEPCMKGNWNFADLRTCLPSYVIDSFLEGMRTFGRQIHGYDREDTILSGVETRTSSPVRIERDDSGQSNIRGLFPCGEGAGYAGGITSASMDGLRIAESVAEYMY
ncbi:MAG: FAD-dependent oxidoreductase [Clostridiales bacterium]|nr:FAD-dependent oxidoreductase [Clostridiales bacterium]